MKTKTPDSRKRAGGSCRLESESEELMAKKSGPKINAGVCSVSSEATFTCRRRGNRSNMRCCKLQGGCSGRSGDGYCHWSAGQRSSPCLVRLGKTNVRFAFLLASEMKFISCNFAVKGKPTHISLWRQFMKSVTKCTKIITNATVTL